MHGMLTSSGFAPSYILSSYGFFTNRFLLTVINYIKATVGRIEKRGDLA